MLVYHSHLGGKAGESDQHNMVPDGLMFWVSWHANHQDIQALVLGQELMYKFANAFKLGHI